MCGCILHIVMFEPMLISTLLVFVKLLITFSVSKYITCVMFVHSFKPCGWHFTNFHYYYQTYRSILLRYDCPSWPPTAYSRSFSTATPTPQRRLLIGATSRHSLVCGSYFSTLDIASPLHQPPTATGKGTSSPVVNHLFA